MKYGQLRVTVVYNADYTAAYNYHVWSWQENGKWLSMTKDLTSVDNAVNTYFDVDVCARPQDVYGDADNITYEWPTPVATVHNSIVHGDNLDDFTEPGVYCRALAASATNVVTNTPPAMYASTFILEVFHAGSGTQLVQRATRCHKASKAVAERTFYGGEWGEWETTYINGRRVLWSGAKYMNASQIIQLSENVSDMPNGIVLVFCGYADGEAQNCDFVEFCVPKHVVASHVGCGHSFMMANSNATKIGHKYLYIDDNQITGHANNVTTGEASGITWNSNYFVLKYVLGW